jgi:hypothetical protein
MHKKSPRRRRGMGKWQFHIFILILRNALSPVGENGAFDMCEYKVGGNYNEQIQERTDRPFTIRLSVGKLMMRNIMKLCKSSIILWVTASTV